jgi:D-alanyl-lipoteichoic acid acyltransferase DltB (MBOAT superfamily)
MYIPLGGSRWRAANVWPIFSFVALWHDLEWRLLGWAWTMALFIAPEMVAKWAGRQPWCVADKGSALFKHLCAAAAAVNILVLMSANLVGFVVGLDGLLPLLHAVLGEPAFAAGMLCVFFCAAHVMFAIRASEQRVEGKGKAVSSVGGGEHEKGF